MSPHSARPSVDLSRPHARHARLLLVVLAAACCLAAAPARAQIGTDYTGNGGKHSIRGRIFFPTGHRADAGVQVRLESNGAGDISVFTDSSGSFNFQGLAAGSYTVVIESKDFETVRERVLIDSDSVSSRSGGGVISTPRPQTVQIYLVPKRPESGESSPGVLNAALAAVPKPALDLYYKALESSRNKQGQKAVEQFRQALAIHPDFALALRDLGAEYLKANQPEKAVEPLRASVKLDPQDTAALLNLGIALFQKKEFSAAEEQLRRALKRDARLATAHYYLGVTLIQRQSLEEAEKELRHAVEGSGDRVALAHYYLGGLYWKRGEHRRAADELEAYLRLSPDAQNAAQVRATVKELRAKS